MTGLAFHWILLLPFFLASWLILRGTTSFSSAWRRLALSLPLGFALIIFLTQLSAAFTRSLPLSTALASGTAALLSLILLWRAKPKLAATWRVEFDLGLALCALLGTALTAMVAAVAWRFNFHDQLPIQAHIPLVQSMLRGNFPPALMVFPDTPLKYHFGGDLFSAVLSYCLNLPAYRGIDLTQILGWMTWLTALYVFARENLLPRWACCLLMLWLPLGAGWAYLLKPWIDNPGTVGLSFAWPHSYVIFGRHLNPGTISNFFMLPYGLGMGMFFSYFALLSHWLRARSAALLAVLAFLLGVVSFVQVTFFLSLGLTTVVLFGLVALWEKPGFRIFAMRSLGWGVPALFIAWLLGGFFISDPGYVSQGILGTWPPGYLRNSTVGGNIPITLAQGAMWYLATFGSVALLALPSVLGAAWVSWKKHSAILLSLAFFSALCFFLPQFFRYRFTWDIIKWFTGFHMGVILLALFLLSSVKRNKAMALLLLSPLIVLDVLPSISFLSQLGFSNPRQVHPSYAGWWRARVQSPDPGLERILFELKQGKWSALVLSTPPFSEQLTRESGQAMAQVDKNTVSFGVAPELLEQRRRQIEELRKNFNMAALNASKISWLVYPCQNFAEQFSESSRQSIETAVRAGQLSDLSYQSGKTCLKVYRLPTPKE